MKIHGFIFVLLMLFVMPAWADTPIPDADSPEAKVYAEKCSACHSLPHPKRLYFEQWQHMLKVMYMRISERNSEPLTEQEQEAILRYLKAHSR
jgi:cytochrome c1